MGKGSERKLVAIAVPVSNRSDLTPDEQISLNHLLRYLDAYDKYFVAPQGLDISHPRLKNKYFDLKYFGSATAHSQLLLSNTFYEAFEDYEYVLIYHLDALVFSDKLTEWCRAGYDYVAPPWIKHRDAPYAGKSEFEGKIGNGGFSLRRVESFLKVINSKELYRDPEDLWQIFKKNRSLGLRLLNFPRKYLYRFSRFNNVQTEISRKVKIEDSFWANRAQHYYSQFKLAPIEVALEFAFECLPNYCYEKNNSKLPFGCHAWHAYDRDFWKPFLLPGALGEEDRLVALEDSSDNYD